MWLGWTFFELSISHISTCSLPLYYFFPIRVVAEIKSWSSHVTCSTFLCLLISHTLLLAPNYINLRIHHTPSLSPGQIVQVNLAGQWQPFKISLYYFISHQIICKLYTWFFPGFCQSSVVSLTISCLAFIDWWLMPELFSVHTWSNENSFTNIATFYFWLKFSQIIWESKLIFSFERSGHHMWLC